MASPINKLIGANLRQHASRYVSTALAVIIATTFVVLALTLMNGISQQYSASLEDETRGTSTIISEEYYDSGSESSDGDAATSSAATAKASQEYFKDIISAVKAIPGVANVVESASAVQVDGDSVSVSPVMNIQIQKDDTRALRGVVYNQSAPLAQKKYIEGKAPSTADEIALDRVSAESLNVKVGDKIRVGMYGSDETREFTITGITALARVSNQASIVVVLTEAGAQSINPQSTRSLKVIPQDSALQSPSASEASQKNLTAEIQKALTSVNAGAKAAGLQFNAYSSEKVLDTSRKSAQTQTGAMTGAVLVFPLISAFVAAIIVGTTFQVIALQRRRELALLRAVGAQAKQVRSLIFRETSAAGIISALIGATVGALLGGAMSVSLGFAVSFADAMTTLPWKNIIITWIVASLITIFVGATPARRASTVSPLAALSPVQSVQEEKRSHRVRVIIATIMLALGVAGTVYGLGMPSEESGQIMARFGIVVLAVLICWIAAMIIFSVALPYIIYAVGVIIPTPVGRLARGNVLRNPSRTASTGIAVIIGVVLMSTISVGVASVQSTIDTQLSKSHPIDVEAASATASLTSQQIKDLENFKYAEKTVAGLGDSAIVNDDQETLLRVVGVPNLNEVARSQVNNVERGTVHVAPESSYANEKTMRVCFVPTGSLETTTAADGGTSISVSKDGLDSLECQTMTVVKDSQVDYGTLRVNIDDLKAADPEAQVSVVYMRIKDGTPFDQVITALTKIGNSVTMGGGYIQRNMYMQALNIIVTVFLVLLAVSVIISLVGVANTLGLSVAERTQENGLLRALGLSKGQMRRLLVLESFLTSLVSTIVGIVLGIIFAIIGMHTLPFNDLSTGIVISLPWGQLIGLLAIIVVASMLAAWLPGRQAAKVSPVEALAHE